MLGIAAKLIKRVRLEIGKNRMLPQNR
jgi:hypothetical protein